MWGCVVVVNGMFVLSSNELGVFELGFVVKYLGFVIVMVFGGSMIFLVVVLSWVKIKDLFGVDII